MHTIETNVAGGQGHIGNCYLTREKYGFVEKFLTFCACIISKMLQRKTTL